MKTEDQDESAYLRRIADSSERTAIHTMLIALPIWIAIVLAVWMWVAHR